MTDNLVENLPVPYSRKYSFFHKIVIKQNNRRRNKMKAISHDVSRHALRMVLGRHIHYFAVWTESHWNIVDSMKFTEIVVFLVLKVFWYYLVLALTFGWINLWAISVILRRAPKDANSEEKKDKKSVRRLFRFQILFCFYILSFHFVIFLDFLGVFRKIKSFCSRRSDPSPNVKEARKTLTDESMILLTP